MPAKIFSNNKLKGIDVVVLSGGRGKRLKKVVSDYPKTMAEINQRPFLDILIDYVSNYGFQRFILATGYLSDVIEEHYKTKNTSQEILFSKDGEKLLGTGGAVKKAEKFIQSSHLLVLNGDTFCPVDFGGFFDFHLKKNALLSMVVVEAKNNKDSGRIVLDNSNRIINFVEKERKKEKKNFLSAGIYLFEREVLSLIPPQTEYSLEYELFPKLTGQEFYGYLTREKFIDIGTPARYLKAKKFLVNKLYGNF